MYVYGCTMPVYFSRGITRVRAFASISFLFGSFTMSTVRKIGVESYRCSKALLILFAIVWGNGMLDHVVRPDLSDIMYGLTGVTSAL